MTRKGRLIFYIILGSIVLKTLLMCMFILADFKIHSSFYLNQPQTRSLTSSKFLMQGLLYTSLTNLPLLFLYNKIAIDFKPITVVKVETLFTLIYLLFLTTIWTEPDFLYIHFSVSERARILPFYRYVPLPFQVGSILTLGALKVRKVLFSSKKLTKTS